MKYVSLSYSQFKQLVTDKSMLAQYVEHPDRYDLFAVESSISWETSILKDSDDGTDFEANHKANYNMPLEYRSSDGLPKVASAKFVESLNLYVDGENGSTTVSAGATVYLKTHYTTPFTLAGVDLRWENVNIGDYIDFEVGFYTDEEDEGTFTPVNKFGNKYKLLGSGSRLFDVPTVKVIPPTVTIAPGVTVNLYIRAKVVNTGEAVSKIALNIVGWK